MSVHSSNTLREGTSSALMERSQTQIVRNTTSWGNYFHFFSQYSVPSKNYDSASVHSNKFSSHLPFIISLSYMCIFSVRATHRKIRIRGARPTSSVAFYFNNNSSNNYTLEILAENCQSPVTLLILLKSNACLLIDKLKKVKG